jgi:transcriptional regulator with PAS, ATPase and Fis domain
VERWSKELPAAITVCDRDGKILEMNDRSVRTLEKDGGAALVGKNVLECHPEPARTRLKEMLESGKMNCYTIEKKGVRKLIYQVPWFADGVYGGLVELSLEIPARIPHFVRT